MYYGAIAFVMLYLSMTSSTSSLGAQGIVLRTWTASLHKNYESSEQRCSSFHCVKKFVFSFFSNFVCEWPNSDKFSAQTVQMHIPCFFSMNIIPSATDSFHDFATISLQINISGFQLFFLVVIIISVTLSYAKRSFGRSSWPRLEKIWLLPLQTWDGKDMLPFLHYSSEGSWFYSF